MKKRTLPKEAEKYKFSSTNQPPPENVGRPRSIMKQLTELTGDSFAPRLCKSDIYKIIGCMMEMTLAELATIHNDKNRPYFMRAIAKALKTGLERGDLTILNALLDRMFGKAAQPIELPPPPIKPDATPLKDLTESSNRLRDLFRRGK